MEDNNKKNKNKKLAIIIITIVIFTIAILIGLYLFLNRPRTAMSTDMFNTTMTNKNYVVTDIINQYDQYDYIKNAYVANNKNYQIEYYTLSNNDFAIQMYNYNKQTFENSKSSKYVEITKDGKNYSFYSLTANQHFKYISRIDNTIIYIDTDEKYKDEIKEIIKELGY